MSMNRLLLSIPLNSTNLVSCSCLI